MKVEQIYAIVNKMSGEYLGETDIVNEDLSNIVDIGSKVINLDNLDKYVRSLIDQIGKMIFVDRPYSGSVPSLYMDGWEYGAILEKVSYDKLPTAEENDSWNLVDGKSYDPNIFTKPQVSAKFFSKKNTFDIPMSFAERQVKSAFQDVTQLNSFFSMIHTAIENSMTVKVDSLAMSAVNYMIATVCYKGSTTRKVNLLKLYNEKYGKTLTADKCLYDPSFIRYAGFVMSLYQTRIGRLSVLFNEGGKDRFTPKDRLSLIMLADFAKAADVFMESDTYHNELVKLPKADIIPYWQGSGLDFEFPDISKINVKIWVDTTLGGNTTRSQQTVEQSGILAVMFDRFACGVANLDRRTTANYNGRAEFFNNWYKFDAGYFNDPDENFVVFLVEDESDESTVSDTF